MRKILIYEVDARTVLELLESAHVATNLVWIRNDCCEVLREALAEQPAQQSAVRGEPNHLEDVRAMVERKIGCVNHDCDKCKAAFVQEPVKWSDYEPDGLHHNKPEPVEAYEACADIRKAYDKAIKGELSNPISKKIIEQPSQQESVAEVKAKMIGGNVGIATVIHEIYSPLREPLQPGDKLYSAYRWIGWDVEQVWSERIFGIDMRFENVQDAIAFRKKLDEATTPQAQPAPEIAIADAYRAGVDSGIAAEREVCAKVCEAHKINGQLVHSNAVVGCAAAIRARGNT